MKAASLPRGGTGLRLPRRCVPAFFLIILSASSLSIVARSANASPPSTLTEWAIPTSESYPTRMALRPEGECCWFLETSANKIAHFEPASGLFEEWQIPTPASRPSGIAITRIRESIAIFGTEFASNKLFLFVPDRRTFQEFPLPRPQSGPWQVSVEPTGTEVRVWVSMLGPLGAENTIAQLLYDPLTETAGLYEWALPEDVGAGSGDVHATSGVVWFVGADAIFKVDRVVNETVVWPTPVHPDAQLVSITVDSLDRVWYTVQTSGAGIYNSIGVLAGNDFTEWRLPDQSVYPKAISIDPLTQTPWIVETQRAGFVDRIGRLEPTGGVISGAKPRILQYHPNFTSIEAVTRIVDPPRLTQVNPTVATLPSSTAEEFSEWFLASGSRPEDVVVDGSGQVWIAESGSNRISQLTPSDPDFSIRALSPTLVIHQGASGGISITASSLRGFTGNVSLSLSGPTPSAVSFSFASNPLSVPFSGVNSTTLITTVGSDASSGLNRIVVVATDQAGKRRPASFFLLILPTAKRDFAVSISPSHLSIAPGSEGSTTMTIRSLNNFNSSVTFSYTLIPNATAVSVEFEEDPVTLAANSSLSRSVTVSVRSNVDLDAFSILITSISGTLSHSSTLTVAVDRSQACLIATASFGSELAPEVVILRDFRDHQAQRTLVGRSFMLAFNSWYYSFSPSVARYLTNHPSELTITRTLIYPLVAILSFSTAALSALTTNAEFNILATGMVASSLIGLFYLTIPFAILRVLSRRLRWKKNGPSMLAVSGCLVLVGLTGLLASELLTFIPAISIFSSLSVLSVILTSGLAGSAALARTKPTQ